MEQTKSHTIKDFYKSYQEYVADNPLYQIEYKTFREIITDYFQYLRDQIIEEGREVKLPCRLGSLYVIKHRPKHLDGRSLRVDYYSTKKYGKLMYHLNEHSDGYKYRFRWDRRECNVPNRSKYNLVMTRQNKRRLASIIKNNERDYFEKV